MIFDRRTCSEWSQRVDHGLITEIEAIFSVNAIQTSGF
jgi:hypothetical protein